MDLVSMLLNTNASRTSGSPRASYASSRASNAATRFEFSDVLKSKLSGNENRQLRQFQLDVKQIEVSRSDARESGAQTAERESSGRRDPQTFFGRDAKEAGSRENESGKSAAELFDGKQANPGRESTREHNRVRSEQQQGFFRSRQFDGEHSTSGNSGGSGESDRRQTIRDIIQDQFQSSDSKKTATENLTEKERQVLQKIEDGNFSFDNEKDVEQLKKLLDKFTDSESARDKQKAVKILKKLFSSEGNLDELLGDNQTPEQLKNQLKDLKEILEKTKSLLEEVSDKANEAVADQLKQGIEKLKDGDKDDRKLEELLKKIEKSLEKETGEQNSDFQQTVESLIKQVDSLIESLSDQSGETPGETVTSRLSNVVDSLNDAFESLTNSSQGESNLLSETVKQFQQALKTAEKVLGDSGLKGQLSKHLREYGARTGNEQPAETQNRTRETAKRTEQRSTDKNDSSKGQASENQSGESKNSSGDSGSTNNQSSSSAETSTGDSSANQPEETSSNESNTSANETDSADSDGQSEAASDSAERAQADKAKDSQAGDSKETTQQQHEQAAKQSEANGAETKNKEANRENRSRVSDRPSGNSTDGESSEETRNRDNQSNKNSNKSDNNKKTNNAKSESVKGESQNKKTNKETQDKQTAKQKSEASSGAKKGNNQQPNSKQSSNGDSRYAKPAENNVKQSEHRETSRSGGPQSAKTSKTEQVEQQARQFKEALNDKVVDKNTSEKAAKEDGKKVQVAESDKQSNKDTSSNKKHVGKMAQYESNSAKAVQSTDGTGAEFSNNSGQQQSNSGNAAMKAKQMTGSDFSQRMREARKVVKQMVEKAQTMVDEGKKTMKLQLKPEVLGEMKLSISLDGDQAKAKVQVEKNAVKNLLDENMNHLKQQMEAIGINLDDVDISEYENEETGDENFWFDEGEPSSEGGDIEETEDDPETNRGHTNPTRQYSSIELVA